jgi:hypothetical protein
MTKRSKAPEPEAPAEHRAEHRSGLPGPLLDALGDPITRAVEQRGPGAPPVVLSDDQTEAAARALRSRVPETRIARELGVNYRTWMRLRDDDDRLASALAEARKAEEEELAGLLIEKARRGETVALIFALKGRHGYRDQGAPPGDGGSRTNIVINLPASMSPDAYSRLIDVTPERLEGQKTKKEKGDTA